MFVTPAGPKIAAAFRTSMVAERLGRAVGDALAAGLDQEEVMELAQSACAAWPLNTQPMNSWAQKEDTAKGQGKAK